MNFSGCKSLHCFSHINELGDTIWDGDYSDFLLDYLSGDFRILPHHSDTSDRQDKEVVLSHNFKIYDSTVDCSFQAHPITPITFFNETGYEFADDYGWIIENNYLEEADNALDPEFEMDPLPASVFEGIFQQRRMELLPQNKQTHESSDMGWWPNLFRQSTLISYSLPSPSFVTVKIYNLNGSEIGSLVEKKQGTGYHELSFDFGSNPLGIYICKLTDGTKVEVRKMILSK